MTPTICSDATQAWHHLLADVVAGDLVAPRGEPTREVLNNAIAFDAHSPVVRCTARKLSRRFLAAEALWILLGRDDVAGIAPYNRRIADFSDDGLSFFGAYGPKFVDQLPYVVKKLVDDRDTRQAVISIWREKPPPTKDVPCTLSVVFSIRRGRVNAHVTMRSSDAWLGFPYDVFNFAMMAARVAIAVNTRGQRLHGAAWTFVGLGAVYWTAASSHLYKRNLDGARACLEELRGRPVGSGREPRIPDDYVCRATEVDLFAALSLARETKDALPEFKV